MAEMGMNVGKVNCFKTDIFRIIHILHEEVVHPIFIIVENIFIKIAKKEEN